MTLADRRRSHCRRWRARSDSHREAERLGVDSVWVPEFWADDALTPLAYARRADRTIRLATGSCSSVPALRRCSRCPRMSLQALSGGRFVLGIGTSGPQVMEGWHGVRVRQAGAPHPRDDRHRPRRSPPASGSSTTGRSTSSRCPTAKAERSARRAAGARPHLRRVARPGQSSPHRRARRRLDRQLVLPRDGRTRSSTRSAKARPRRPLARRTSTSVVSVGVEFTDDVERGRPPPRRGLRVHVRRDGLRRRRTSTTTPSPARATATTSAVQRALAGRRPRRRRGRGSRSRSDSAPTSSGRPR